MSKPQPLISLEIDQDLDCAITVRKTFEMTKEAGKKGGVARSRTQGLRLIVSVLCYCYSSHHHPILSLCIMLKVFSVEQSHVKACFTVCFMHCIYCV